LKSRWHLFKRGDVANLPLILSQCPAVQLFHYDSDKSYSGRRFATALVSPRLASSAIYLMDDIQDNLFFRDFVSETGAPFDVFAYQGKFLGAIGLSSLQPANLALR
jgi:hypothetical protein